MIHYYTKFFLILIPLCCLRASASNLIHKIKWKLTLLTQKGLSFTNNHITKQARGLFFSNMATSVFGKRMIFHIYSYIYFLSITGGNIEVPFSSVLIVINIAFNYFSLKSLFLIPQRLASYLIPSHTLKFLCVHVFPLSNFEIVLNEIAVHHPCLLLHTECTVLCSVIPQ